MEQSFDGRVLMESSEATRIVEGSSLNDKYSFLIWSNSSLFDDIDVFIGLNTNLSAK